LRLILPLATTGLVLLWAVWPILKGMAVQWETRPDYSHGWLVPLLAIVVLWSRRSSETDSTLATFGKILVGGAVVAWAMGSVEQREWQAAAAAAVFVVGSAVLFIEWAGSEKTSGPNWLGIGLLAAGGALQLCGAIYYFEWFERLAIVPLVMGAVLMVAGRKAFWWSLPATAFLVFMVPLPYRLEIALREPLKDLGTSTSTYLMQTLGMPAYAEGFVISVGEAKIGVVEACSGLRMLTVFLALSAALAVIVDRPAWQKWVLFFSAFPISLIANILRITATGTCYVNGWDRLAEVTFHDLAGWMMMPLGIVLLLAELWILDRLVVTEVDRPMAVGIGALASPAQK
jgi:exosortase